MRRVNCATCLGCSIGYRGFASGQRRLQVFKGRLRGPTKAGHGRHLRGGYGGRSSRHYFFHSAIAHVVLFHASVPSHRGYVYLYGYHACAVKGVYSLRYMKAHYRVGPLHVRLVRRASRRHRKGIVSHNLAYE